MAGEVSLTDYIAQAQQGLFSRMFGPDYLQKQTYLQVSTSTFNQTYGRKVWDALNNKTVFFNCLKKVPWGNTAGWVLRTDRGVTATTTRARPITEVGTLPTVDVSAYIGVYGLPKIIAATFGASIRTIFVNTLEGGMGDILSIELAGCERDFCKEVNSELLAATAMPVSTGAATSFTVPASMVSHFRIGDEVAMFDDNANSYVDTARTVSGVNTTTGVATIGTGTAFADNDVVYIKSRAGMTSIDDLTMYDDVLVSTGAQANKAATDVYNLATRASGAYAGGLPSYNSGTSRDLALNLLDARIQAIRVAGGEPKLIVMGWDQYFNLERLLNAQQRYMGQEVFQVGVGDERTLPGTRTGLVLATYMGIPILPDPDAPASVASDDTVLGTNVYVLDTDYLELAVAMPTQYVENRNYFDAGALVVRGLFFGMMELRCYRPDVQGKISNLSA